MAFQSVPKIAIAPLIVFFPVLVAGFAGFKSVKRERRDVMQSLGASKWQTFTMLVLGVMGFVLVQILAFIRKGPPVLVRCSPGRQGRRRSRRPGDD
ncbi:MULTISPECIES: hypothetical protein [unclassified Arthrobacter]|uniref:hypothetical protein n=1 Tax=unclassified Arthrobacter TaxID=235627 RepID=UPI00339651E6